MTPDDLLAGPRGRRFALSLLHEALDPESAAAERLGQARFWADYHLSVRRGDGIALFGPGAGDPAPDPGVDEVARSIAGAADVVDAGRLDPTGVLRALAETADSAMSWQEPDATDVLLGMPASRAALDRLATVLAGSPLVAALVDVGPTAPQWRTTFEGEAHAAVGSSAATVLRDWRAELLAEVDRATRRDRRRPAAANVSGSWWSTPPSGLLTTTPSTGDGADGPIGLWAVEDGFGWEHATVAAATPPTGARVLVVDDAADWAHLCRRWSVDVSDTTRRHDWYRTTGRDGRWVTPDWVGVAEEYDAVHLTVRGWLRAAGTAVEVDDRNAGVIAGWTPGTTAWLTDPSPSLGSGEPWSRRGHDAGWTTD